MKRYIKSAVNPVGEEDYLTRRELAISDRTSSRDLAALANDTDALVKMSVIQNPNTPNAVKENMYKDNPDLETDISFDFWAETEDFPLEEFESELISRLNASEFGKNLVAYDVEPDESTWGITMQDGRTAYYYDMNLYFNVIYSHPSDTVDAIHKILVDTVTDFAANPHGFSAGYNYGNW